MSQSEDDPNETLLTEKSLKLSLSAPRSPPYGTAHHSILLGNNPLDDPYAEHHKELAHSNYNQHSGVKEGLMHLIYNTSIADRIRHPHLSLGPELGDHMTRYLGSMLPVSWQNSFRDKGQFRDLMDNLVTYSIPTIALSNPRAVRSFLQLSRQCQTLSYGDHDSQFVDLFFPDCPEEDMKGLVFFIHGGAWGSGKPWFYRVIAQPFLDRNMAVAIVGYRVYPAGDVNIQVADTEAAYQFLSEKFPNLCGPTRRERPIGLCLMGHSSGAHIAMLLAVEQAKRLQSTLGKALFDVFVGISGPYDISHHFDYEAARGVEELSPMKAANGHTRQEFHRNSPAWRVQQFLMSFEESPRLCLDNFFPRTLLVHGIEDETVPFTATAEAANILRHCGISLEESYVPKVGHQDAVTDLALGGRGKAAILDWLEQVERGDKKDMIRSRL